MLVFREGPEGDFNDLLFLSSIVNYNIYLHPPQGDPTNCYYLYIHSVTCTNTLFTQDIANSFSAMLHFCNYEHKLDPTGIITFGIGNSFKFSMLNSKLAIMLDSWGHNKFGSWIIEVLYYYFVTSCPPHLFTLFHKPFY